MVKTIQSCVFNEQLSLNWSRKYGIMREKMRQLPEEILTLNIYIGVYWAINRKENKLFCYCVILQIKIKKKIQRTIPPLLLQFSLHFFLKFTLKSAFIKNILYHRKCHPVIWLRLRRRASSRNRAVIHRPATGPAASHLQTRSLSSWQCNQTHGQRLYVFHMC